VQVLIVVVVQDEFSFQLLVVLNVEDVIDVDIQDIPMQTEKSSRIEERKKIQF
jgi:hypothetical protein